MPAACVEPERLTPVTPTALLIMSPTIVPPPLPLATKSAIPTASRNLLQETSYVTVGEAPAPPWITKPPPPEDWFTLLLLNLLRRTTTSIVEVLFGVIVARLPMAVVKKLS